jgi:SHS2 domain-containing protein
MVEAKKCKTGTWEHFPHGADVGVRGIGETLEEAFAQAALALTAVVSDPDGVAASDEVSISCEAPDAELLLTDWLNALVYEMATRHMLFSRFELRIEDGRLEARAWGERLDVHRHQPTVEVKGATYTGLEVSARPGGGWLAQCIVDV